MMQHPMENMMAYPPFEFSHYYQTFFPLTHKSQVLHQCPITRSDPYTSSCSTCHPRPTSTHPTTPGIQEISSSSKPNQRPFKAILRGRHEFRNLLYNDKSFQVYRNTVLSNLSPNNQLCTSMRRLHKRDASRIEDPEYSAKRKKNNEAAKRSREARKMKEDELAVRCAFLEQENLRLKVMLSALENETRILRDILMHPISNS